jgi:hypothetical protein
MNVKRRRNAANYLFIKGLKDYYRRKVLNTNGNAQDALGKESTTKELKENINYLNQYQNHFDILVGKEFQRRLDHPVVLLTCLLLDDTNHMQTTKIELHHRLKHAVKTFEVAVKRGYGSLTYRPFLTHNIPFGAKKNCFNCGTWWMRCVSPSNNDKEKKSREAWDKSVEMFTNLLYTRADILSLSLSSEEKLLAVALFELLKDPICSVSLTKCSSNGSSNNNISNNQTVLSLFSNRGGGSSNGNDRASSLFSNRKINSIPNTASSLFSNRSGSSTNGNDKASSLFSNRNSMSNTTTSTTFSITDGSTNNTAASSAPMKSSLRSLHIIWRLHNIFLKLQRTPKKMVQLTASFALTAMIQLDVEERCHLLIKLMEEGSWKWCTFQNLQASTWMINASAMKSRKVRSTIEKILECVAQEVYKESKEPNDVLLYYILLGKIQLLSAMYRSKHKLKISQFLLNTTKLNLTSIEKSNNNRQATKNAAALMKQGKAAMAAGFFLIATPPRVRDAINVLCSRCNSQDGDRHLSVVIAYLCDYNERVGSSSNFSGNSNHMEYTRKRWFPISSSIDEIEQNNVDINRLENNLEVIYEDIAVIWSLGEYSRAKDILGSISEHILLHSNKEKVTRETKKSMENAYSIMCRIVRMTALPSLLWSINRKNVSAHISLLLRNRLANNGAFQAALLPTLFFNEIMEKQQDCRTNWAAHLLVRNCVLPSTTEAYKKEDGQSFRERYLNQSHMIQYLSNLNLVSKDVQHRALELLKSNEMLSYRYDLRCDLLFLLPTDEMNIQTSLCSLVEEIHDRTLMLCHTLRTASISVRSMSPPTIPFSTSFTALKLLTMSICADQVGRRLIEQNSRNRTKNNRVDIVLRCSRVGIFTALCCLPRFGLVHMYLTNLLTVNDKDLDTNTDADADNDNDNDNDADTDTTKSSSNLTKVVCLDEGMRSVLMDVVARFSEDDREGISGTPFPGREKDTSKKNAYIYTAVLLGSVVKRYALIEREIFNTERENEYIPLLDDHLTEWAKSLSENIIQFLHTEVLKSRPFEDKDSISRGADDQTFKIDVSENKVNKRINITSFEARVILRKMYHALLSIDSKDENIDEILNISVGKKLSIPPSTNSRKKSKTNRKPFFLRRRRRRSEDERFNAQVVNEGGDVEVKTMTLMHYKNAFSSSSSSASYSTGLNLPKFDLDRTSKWLIHNRYVHGESEVDELLQLFENLNLISTIPNTNVFMPCRPARVSLFDPKRATEANSSYQEWNDLTTSLYRNSTKSLTMNVDPVPHCTTKYLRKFGPSAIELWKMAHTSTYFLHLIIQLKLLATAINNGTNVPNKNVVNKTQKIDFVSSALQSGLLSKFGYSKLRVFWEIDVQLQNLQLQKSSHCKHIHQIYGAMWLDRLPPNASRVAQLSGIDRSLLLQHGGCLISKFHEMNESNHHFIFRVPIPPAANYQDALFWGNGGDKGATPDFSWFHLLPPPPPSLLNISLYMPSSGMLNFSADAHVGNGHIEISEQCNEVVQDLQLRNANSDSASRVEGKFSLTIQQRVVLSSDDANYIVKSY